MAVLFCAASTSAQPTMTDLGSLGYGSTIATAMSADGSVVVGMTDYNSAEATAAFRWTDAGMTAIVIPTYILSEGRWGFARALGVSPDGLAVVGDTSLGSFRWIGGQVVYMQQQFGESFQTRAISADYTRAAGYRSLSTAPRRAVRFTVTGPAMTWEDVEPIAGFFSEAYDISRDGQVVVGYSSYSASATLWHAFRWTPTGLTQDLGTLGGTRSQARAISGDGLVIVGSSTIASGGGEGFRWTAVTGMQSTGATSGSDVNWNGSTIVGTTSVEGFGSQAAMWKPTIGAVNLNSYLPSLGVNLNGEVLYGANAVSDDGTAIIVNAVSGKSFIIRNLPLAGACCLPGNTCQVMTATACSAQSGVFAGDGIVCAGANCVAFGACCLSDGSCQVLALSACANQGGVFGPAANCTGISCPQPGACCLPSGLCTMKLPLACLYASGTFQGAGVACSTVSCPQPGACCLVTGGCAQLRALNCASDGGVFHGDGSLCASANCAQGGACCLSNLICVTRTAAACAAENGIYRGNGTPCGDCSALAACRWQGFGTGVNAAPAAGTVYTVLQHDLGDGPMLYIGGSFTTAGGQPAQGLARWTGTAWEPVGTGLGTVRALLSEGTTGIGNLYIGHTNGLSIWDGTTLSTPSGGPVNGPVYALAHSTSGSGPGNSRMVVGGSFTEAGSLTVNNIGELSSGGNWEALSSAGGPGGGTPGTNGPVYAVAYLDGNIYAAGQFTTAGNQGAARIAMHSGNNWQALGQGIGGTASAWPTPVVFGLDVHQGELYVVGDFTQAGGQAAQNLATWDGAAWNTFGGLGVSGPAFTVLGTDTGFIVGGAFALAGGAPAQGIARRFAGVWSGFGNGLQEVRAIYLPQAPSLLPIAGGRFTTAGVLTLNNIGRFGCTVCYANCDLSANAPVLTPNDFQCFLNRFAEANVYANCDGSTGTPLLTPNDFACFLNKFANGCL